MRVPWLPNVAGPGDALQFRRAQVADGAASSVVAPLQPHVSSLSSGSGNGGNIPPPSLVPMHTPSKRLDNRQQNARQFDELFDGW